MATLAEIRAKLKDQETRSSGSNRGPSDNAIYPFWNLKEGESSTVRFLPDGDSNNTFFWKERLMIKLPFAGIKGETDSRPVQVQVPCMEMYGESCPILAEVRGWFKDPSLEDLGRKYWKKRSYIFQGFVTDNALQEDGTPENPIRRFIIGPQIFNIIRGALLDPEMEDLPTDYIRGVDFRINKTSKGGYADYSTSKWSRRESALTETQNNAINTNGLYNLNDFLPKKPSEVELKVMKEMFEASVNGESYDAEKFGSYYKPAGMSQATGDPNKQTVMATAETVTPPVEPKPAQAEVVFQPEETPAAPVQTESAPTTEASSKAEDILKLIRERKQAQ